LHAWGRRAPMRPHPLTRPVSRQNRTYAGAVPSAILEPRHEQLVRWQVVVLGAALPHDPPAALMPAEVEMYHTQVELMKQEQDLAEQDMLQVSCGMIWIWCVGSKS